jgi:hypothetical protein
VSTGNFLAEKMLNRVFGYISEVGRASMGFYSGVGAGWGFTSLEALGFAVDFLFPFSIWTLEYINFTSALGILLRRLLLRHS